MEKIQAYRQIKKNLIVKKIMISVLSSMMSLFMATLLDERTIDFILEFRIEFYQTFCIQTLNFN